MPVAGEVRDDVRVGRARPGAVRRAGVERPVPVVEEDADRPVVRVAGDDDVVAAVAVEIARGDVVDVAVELERGARVERKGARAGDEAERRDQRNGQYGEEPAGQGMPSRGATVDRIEDLPLHRPSVQTA